MKALTTRTCIKKLLLRRYTVCIDDIAICSCIILDIRHKPGENDDIELNLRVLLEVTNLHCCKINIREPNLGILEK
jgi:hypothetical protein